MMHTHEMLFLISVRKNSLQIVFEIQLVDDSCGQKLWAETKRMKLCLEAAEMSFGDLGWPSETGEGVWSFKALDLLHLHTEQSRFRWFGDVARILIGRLLV